MRARALRASVIRWLFNKLISLDATGYSPHDFKSRPREITATEHVAARTRTSNVYTPVRVRINLMNRDVCTHAYVHLMPITIAKKRLKTKKKKKKETEKKPQHPRRLASVYARVHKHARARDRTAAVRGDYQIYSLLAGGIVRASNVTHSNANTGEKRIFRRYSNAKRDDDKMKYLPISNRPRARTLRSSDL